MPELSSSTYSEIDGSNNQAAPNGMPEGMPPSGVNDAWRAGMGAVKRAYDRDHAGSWCTVGGTANAVALTYAVAPASYVQGEKYAFKATAANIGATTINVNGLGAVNLFKRAQNGPVALTGGEIQAGDLVEIEYDGTQFQIMSQPASALASLNIGQGLGNDGSGNLRLNSWLNGRVVAPTANAALTASDSGTVFNSFSSPTAIIFTLPQASTLSAGWNATFFRNAHNITINTHTGDGNIIDLSNASGSLATNTLSLNGDFQEVTLWYDGGGFHVYPHNPMTQAALGMAASKAQMQNATANAVVTADIAKQSDSAAKAWASVAANASTNGSFGVASVTSSGQGVYTINWSTAFASTGYAVIATPANNDFTWCVQENISARATTSATVNIINPLNGQLANEPFNIVAFGRQ